MAKELTIWEARMLNPDDYETLVKWWNYWRFTPPPKEFLPQDGTFGVMLKDTNGVEYCAGFIYITNSSAAWLEFIVSNPEIKDKNKRKTMLEELIKQLTYLAEINGVKWVFTSVKNKSLIDRFTGAGFVTGSVGTTEMIKNL